MEFAVIRRRIPLLGAAIWSVIALVLSTSIAVAQGIELSAKERQMLNQLPPAQRQQALDAMRQLQSAQSGSDLQPLRESDGARNRAGELSPQVSKVGPAEEDRADVGSRLVIQFIPKDLLTPQERAELEQDPAFRRLSGSHAFTLDDSGVLSLHGLGVIPLLGLTQADIARRLGAEPYLESFDIDVRILRAKPTGVEALTSFGYDIFEPHESSFDPPMTGPVPADYALGPGDTVRIQLFGNVNGIYEHDVTRDGILNLPEIGPVNVAGIPFSEFRQDINNRVQEMLIGTQVSVTMGQIRTIRVFALGDVNQPGSYVVSGLATISSALYRSGGISRVGSLRNVQLKRNGKVVTVLDIYDLLLSGDTSDDRRLQPGDAIFVPPIGATVSIGGAVKRPAIYETTDKTSISDAIRLSGGLAPDAFGQASRLERIDVDGNRKVLAINLNSPHDNGRLVKAGDILLVPEVLPNLTDSVTLSGFVHRPGPYQWHLNMRLTDLISSTDSLKPGVDTEYLLIRRQKEPGQPIQVIPANLEAALRMRTGDENLKLEPRDTVHVFSRAMGRQRVVEPLLEELRLYSSVDLPTKEVQIVGNVRAPGVYPLGPQMRVSDLIRAGGNLSESAYTLEAELTRYSVEGADRRKIEVVKVDLDAIRRGVETADIVLREHDYLIVNRVPEWDITWTVALEGEVRFPGQYRVQRGETLGAVVRRAGGLTENAFPEGAVFLRERLKEQERVQINKLARRLEADVASLSLQAAESGGAETLATGKVLLQQLRETKPVGRLVVDMKAGANGAIGPAGGIKMRDGDHLLIPTIPQVVTVLGETQQNTSHVYRDYKTRDDYINQSGGLTRRADEKLIYVVRANGQVIAARRSRWLGRSNGVDIRPGDTIVVPLDIDRIRPLTFWTNVTQILYQGAIAVAAVKTFDN